MEERTASHDTSTAFFPGGCSLPSPYFTRFIRNDRNITRGILLHSRPKQRGMRYLHYGSLSGLIPGDIPSFSADLI
jgi:hypothetical protein